MTPDRMESRVPPRPAAPSPLAPQPEGAAFHFMHVPHGTETVTVRTHRVVNKRFSTGRDAPHPSDHEVELHVLTGPDERPMHLHAQLPAHLVPALIAALGAPTDAQLALPGYAAHLPPEAVVCGGLTLLLPQTREDVATYTYGAVQSHAFPALRLTLQAALDGEAFDYDGQDFYGGTPETEAKLTAHYVPQAPAGPQD